MYLRRSVGYLFSGSGNNYVGMGRNLYDSDSAFRATFDEASSSLDKWLDKPIKETIFGDDDTELHSLSGSAAALFIIQVSLSSYWTDKGIVPSFAFAHSLGAHASAWCAGAISMHEASELLKFRTQCLETLKAPGGMCVIAAPVQKVEEIISEGNLRAEVASVNTDRWTTCAGSIDDIDSLIKAARIRGIGGRRHKISSAFHSSKMNPMLLDYRKYIEWIGARKPKFPIYTSSGIGDKIIDTNFWVDQIRLRMNFPESYMRMRENFDVDLLEIGPDKALLIFAEEAEAKCKKNIGVGFHYSLNPNLETKHSETLTAILRYEGCDQ